MWRRHRTTHSRLQPALSADEVTMLPMLGRGRHRNPRRGACFMELASYLAGERWSDAPPCTDPALALLARMVNDATSDEARPRLAPMVPSVIGIHGLPAAVAGDLALIAAIHSLTEVAAYHQQSIAVGTLRLLSVPSSLTAAAPRARAREALDAVPHAQEWATRFLQMTDVRRVPAHYSPAVPLLEVVVIALATSLITDRDARLRELLVEGIAHARSLARAPDAAPVLEARSWREQVAAAR